MGVDVSALAGSVFCAVVFQQTPWCSRGVGGTGRTNDSSVVGWDFLAFPAPLCPSSLPSSLPPPHLSSFFLSPNSFSSVLFLNYFI